MHFVHTPNAEVVDHTSRDIALRGSKPPTSSKSSRPPPTDDTPCEAATDPHHQSLSLRPCNARVALARRSHLRDRGTRGEGGDYLSHR
mmetsp:Transcript_8460/g.10411  ORF Transcript_8460/g.10411 Transcript_8460/m.10411 type:complete len:88 (+) Transcript_8460:799-1062(+)